MIKKRRLFLILKNKYGSLDSYKPIKTDKMKKLLLIFAISLGFTTATLAQDATFGGKAGLNIASLTGDDSNADGTIGFFLGGYGTFMLSDEFALQGELLFSQQGADDFSLSYINIPVLAKYYVSEEISLHFGPQLGILVAAENDDFVKPTDFSLALGGEYQLESGLSFNLRYAFSLTSIGEEFTTPAIPPFIPASTVDFNLRNSVIQIGVGYAFN